MSRETSTSRWSWSVWLTLVSSKMLAPGRVARLLSSSSSIVYYYQPSPAISTYTSLRIRQKHKIPLVLIIKLERTGCCIDDQENSRGEASFNAPQDNRAIIMGRVKSIQRKANFHSLTSSWHNPCHPKLSESAH